jgi:hypothetical protein
MADTYKILTQRQSVEINPAGNNFQSVWEITYRVETGAAKGTVATVSVPDADHNADYVDKAIRAKIADLGKIHALGS